jgi:hypothetical protein
MKRAVTLFGLMFALVIFMGKVWAEDTESDESATHQSTRKGPADESKSRSVGEATSDAINGMKSTVDLNAFIEKLKKGSKSLKDVDAAIARALEDENIDLVERLVAVRQSYLGSVEYSSSRKAECSKSYASKELKCSASHDETLNSQKIQPKD